MLHGRQFIHPVAFAMVMAMQANLIIARQQRLFRVFRRFLDGLAIKINEDFPLAQLTRSIHCGETRTFLPGHQLWVSTMR